jgi:tetratricopeptide (TPR) repeat protein
MSASNPSKARLLARHSLPIILLALLAACAAQEDQFSSAPPSLHVGQVALQAGEPEIAITVANGQLARKPGDPNALLLRGDARAAKGETRLAAADYRQVLATDPASADAALGFSRLTTAADPATAEAVLAAVVARGDATAAIWNNIGVARDLQNRHAEAQEAYRKALAADPDMLGAQVNLAHSQALAANTAPGGSHVLEVRQVLADNAQPNHAAGATPDQTAEVTPDQMTEAKPDQVPEAKPNQVTEAKPNQVTEAKPDQVPEAKPKQVTEAAKPADACHDAAKPASPAEALQCDPVNLEARRTIVYAAIDDGAYGFAKDVSKEAIRLAPADPRGYLMLADTDRAVGNYGRALTGLRKARSLLESPPP